MEISKENQKGVLAFKTLHKRSISYRRIYKDITGSTVAGVILSQLMYWGSKYDKFWKTDKDIMKETGVTENELRGAKPKIRDLPFIIVTQEGLPRRTCYEISWTKTISFINDFLELQNKNSEIHDTEKTNDLQYSEIHDTGSVNLTRSLYRKSTLRKSTSLNTFTSVKEGFPKKPLKKHLNGLVCKICGQEQFDTPSGTSCINGHGGVEGIKKRKLRKKKKIKTKTKIKESCKKKNDLPNPFNYTKEAFKIIEVWKSFGGNAHKRANATKGPRLINNMIEELLMPGSNPYIKLVDEDCPIRTKQWTVQEICDCIEQFAGIKGLNNDISKMYFNRFVVMDFKGQNGYNKKDLSILANTYENLPPKESKKYNVGPYFKKKYNQEIFKGPIAKIGRFLEQKDMDYKSIGRRSNSIKNKFTMYINEKIEREGKEDALKYMHLDPRLDEFIKTQVKEMLLKRRTIKEKEAWVKNNQVNEAD